jgi:hypothetical protein
MILITVLCLLAQQATGAVAQADTIGTSEQAVVAVYKQMEQADRTGDGQLWFHLRSRKTLAAMSPAVREAIGKSIRARPTVQYEALSTRVTENRAIILGRVTDGAAGTTQFQIALFTKEDDEWRLSREQWSDKPFDPFVLYALLPPQGGAFVRAGSPWKRIRYAAVDAQTPAKDELQWKL